MTSYTVADTSLENRQITNIVRLPSVVLIMYHTLHMRCCRPDLVTDIFLSVALTCEGLKSAEVLETATRSKKT